MIKYYIVSRKNPQNKSEKYYAQKTAPQAISLDTIASNIAARNTLTRADILAVLASLQEEVITHLQQGNSVRLGDLGCFRCGLSSTGALEKNSFSSRNIKRVMVRFTPSPKIRYALQPGSPGVNFQKVAAPGEDEVIEEGGV